jgi:parallel beta-helix repeat protein
MRVIRQLFVLFCGAAALLVFPGSSVAATNCNLWASPGGSDGGDGSQAAPFQTVQRLADALSAGQTGCLESGTYRGAVQFNRGGSAGAPLTLTAAPGAQARVVGRMWIPRGSDWITVRDLHLDGVNSDNLPSPTINSADDQFDGDDVTDDHTAICFLLGSDDYGRAANTVIDASHIHDCGVLPAQNHDHGIYVEDAVGTRIVDNWIYNNADRGIQLYPNAQDSTITGNVIDHNGEGIIISGTDEAVSSNNLITGNVISNSTVRADVESYWETSRKGTGNLVVDNCVYGGKTAIERSAGGFQAHDNLYADPRYVDPAAQNYALSPSSGCAPVLNKGAGFEGRAEQLRGTRLRLPRVFHSLGARLLGAAHGELLVIQGRMRGSHVHPKRRVLITVYAWLSNSWRRVETATRRRGYRFRIRHHVAWGASAVKLRIRVHLGGAVRTAILTVGR